MDNKTSSCLSTLDLVCCPLSNSLAVKLSKKTMAEEIIRESDFYMICGRPEAKFGDFLADKDNQLFRFSIEISGKIKDYGWIKIDAIPNIPEDLIIRIEYTSDQIAFFVLRDKHELLAAFTPDDVLMRIGRKEDVVGGFHLSIELLTYDLLYVGIAKKGDSYDRLFKNGHKARMEILANEPQRYPGARVSDETYLLLFKVEPLFIKSFGPESDIQDFDLNLNYDLKKLVVDAEKALVSLLKPKYNNELYSKYPRGKDGLYNSGLSSYTYAISEGIALQTQFGTIKGGREKMSTLSNEADFILVKGDLVTFHIAGVDFEVELNET